MKLKQTISNKITPITKVKYMISGTCLRHKLHIFNELRFKSVNGSRYIFFGKSGEFDRWFSMKAGNFCSNLVRSACSARRTNVAPLMFQFVSQSKVLDETSTSYFRLELWGTSLLTPLTTMLRSCQIVNFCPTTFILPKYLRAVDSVKTAELGSLRAVAASPTIISNVKNAKKI